MGEERGSIGFVSTCRPPVPWDLYSCPVEPTSADDEFHLTDGKSYNYNGHQIPSTALKSIIEAIKRHPKLKTMASPSDVDSGGVSGLMFVSERHEGLEILHIALRLNTSTDDDQVEVFNFAEVYGTFDGPRLEDCPGFAGDGHKYLVYVSTKDHPGVRREPWNAVFRTHLVTGKTRRLTPPGVADFSPSVSPSGKKIAVATLQSKEDGWDGEIEDLKTDIAVMDVDAPYTRKVVIKNGGWPSWGNENVLFFHRRTGQDPNTFKWGVFQAVIDHTDGSESNISPVSPKDSDAMTPVALNATTVAMAIIRKRIKLGTTPDHRDNFRHIEIFYLDRPTREVKITQMINDMTDYYNPFIMIDSHGRRCIGYHRCNPEQLKAGDVSKVFNKVKSPQSDVGLFRGSVMFPTFSEDGKKMAFVDNKLKTLWLADEKEVRPIYIDEGEDGVFCPVWNKNPEKDTLYFCRGASSREGLPAYICALIGVSAPAGPHFKWLNRMGDGFNNAFPSTNSEGTMLVFRSTRASKGDNIYKNLYIMDAEEGEYGFGREKFTRLTNGPWTDTQCQWSSKGDWIVFSSNRLRHAYSQSRPPKRDDLPDAGYYSVFLVHAKKPEVQVRVIGSGNEINNVPGHVCYPLFSHDGRSIVFTSDLAGVSIDPISLPLAGNLGRPYGDIFSVDIDVNDIEKNENVKEFHRLTHSRFDNSTPSWNIFSTRDLVAWNLIFEEVDTGALLDSVANLYVF